MSGTKLKWAGIITTIAGFGLNILSEVIASKRQKEEMHSEVEECVNKWFESKNKDVGLAIHGSVDNWFDQNYLGLISDVSKVVKDEIKK